MVVNYYILLNVVYNHFGNLVISRNSEFFRVFLSHFLNTSQTGVIIIECLFIILVFILSESNTSINDMIISILVKFSCFDCNVLDSFDQTIVISVRVIFNNSFTSVNFNDLSPLHFMLFTVWSWVVVFNCFEFKWKSSSNNQFIRSMFEKISNFLDFQSLIILINSYSLDKTIFLSIRSIIINFDFIVK